MVKKFPFVFYGFAMLGDHFYTDLDWQRTITYNKRWAQLTNTWQPYERIIHGFCKLGEIDSARFYTKKLMEIFPNKYEVYIHLGYQFLIEDNIKEAIHSLHTGMSLFPDAKQYFGRTLALVHFYTEQVDSFWVDNKDYDNFFDLTNVLLHQGKCEKLYRALNEWNPEKSDQITRKLKFELILHDFLGNMDLTAEIWNKISDYSFSKTSDFYVVDSLSSFSLPSCYYNGDFSTAFEYCNIVDKEIASRQLPKVFSVRNSIWKANILFSQKNFKESAHEYNTLYKIDNFNTIILYRLAQCYFNLGEFEKAKEILNRIKPTGALVGTYGNPMLLDYSDYINLGHAYAFPRSFYLLGKVNEKLGETQEATKAYQKFLDIWKNADEDLPEKTDAQKRLANLTGD